ncbi:MAG: hypothetical protein EZS28_038634, partial [Streblomastix strix]
MKKMNNKKNAYKQLPSPINVKFVVNIIVSLSAELIILAGLIIVVVVFVIEYSGVAASLVISGMRPAYLAQMHYFCLRLLYPYSQIDPKDNITLMNTNPVWKDSSHVLPDRAVIMRLLIGVMGQFTKVHHNTHYGATQFTLTNDSLLDELKTGRLNTNYTTTELFSNSSCLMIDTTKCEDQPGNPEGVGTSRIYSALYPISVSGSSILTGLNSSTTQKNKRGDTNDQIRFIITAIRSDVTEGVKEQTDQILQIGVDQISLSVNVLMFMVI